MAAGAHELSVPAASSAPAATVDAVVTRRLLDPDAAAAPIADLAPPGPLRAILTTGAAGDMRLPAARRRVCAALDLAPERVRRVLQRHTRRVVVAGHEPEPAPLPADGMIARAASQVLCIGVADCLPIFLIAGDGERSALLHSGWRGTGIVADALAYLERRFARAAASYHAIIGPGIGPCCYTVPAERAIRFRARFGPEAAEVSGAGGRIDLRAANVGLLQRAGVGAITVLQDCTACSPALISFRADRAAGRNGARRMTALLGVIGP